MPKKLHGKKLTPREHRQWKHVDGDRPAQATAAVLKSRKSHKRHKR